MEVVLIIAAACGIFIYFWLGDEKGRYSYGRNPAVRCCDRCGQTQHAYCDTMENWDNEYWVSIGEIKNPKCKCHRDTK
jgi:hypothetical protein